MINLARFAVFLCFCQFIQPIAAQSSLALSPTGASSAGADSLNLTLTSAANQPAALQWTVSYPASVTGFSVSAGPALLAAGKSVNCAGSASAYTCLASGMNSNVIGNGVVGTITFVPVGTASVALAFANAVAVSPVGSSIPISAIGTVFTVNTTPPTVSITAPANGAYVNGSAETVTATATDSVGVTGVQFKLDGAILGAVVTGTGPSYSLSWNTAGIAPGLHTLNAVATDTAGNTATSSTSVTMDTTPPAVSMAAPANGATVAGTITVTANATDTVGVSSVQFKLDGANLGGVITGAGPIYSYSWNTVTTAYGSHTLSAVAVDAAGNTAASGNIALTINNPLLLLHSDQTEVSGVTNGSVVTPSIAPAGFAGAVVLNGTGSVNYTPAETGNGVYFENCCVNTNNAYYKFTSAAVGNIFNMSQGQITFYLKSRYSFAQRSATAASPRYAFDVRDGNGNHLFYFLTQVSSGYLFFNYGIAGTAQYTWLQHGTEDAIFGSGVILQVQMKWSAGVTNLYLNGTLVKSAPTSGTTANWSAGSIFDLGAYEYQTFGGFYTSDDVIDEFAVNGPAGGASLPTPAPTPTVTMTAPTNGFTVSGTTAVTANAADGVALTGVQFQLDGANLGSVTGAGPSYSYSWNTKSVANGSHTLTAITNDTAGNTATCGESVTVNNLAPPTVTITAPASGSTVSGTAAVTASATDGVTLTGVQFQLDGASLASVTGTGPSYSYSWSTKTAANGSHTLTAITSDTAGNSATSSVSIIVNNVIVPPVISAVTVGTVISTGATITWTTDQASTSQVAYGATSSFGSLSALNGTLANSHSVTLTGLTAATTYYYEVESLAVQGGLATSPGFTFTTTTASTGTQPLLEMHLDQTEVSGVSNGSVVTPSVAPAGFTGAVVMNGTGSANYAPAQTGNGVYFENCCTNTNNAYYKFTSATVGNIFNINQGQITFYLKSQYSFAQRTASAPSPRYAFDVRDGNGNHLFYFLTQVSSGYLFFSYGIAGTAQYTWLQHGTEDAIFGNGVILQVQMTWSAGVTNLYLNGTLVKSAPITGTTPNWSASSVFDLGAYEYQTFGGFYGCDDVIDEFTVNRSVIAPSVAVNQ